MASAVHLLDVMRSNPTSPGPGGQEPTYSPSETLLATAGVVLAIVVLLFALANPEVALAAVAVGVGAHPARRTVARLRAARRTERTRRYCIPGTEICIEP